MDEQNRPIPYIIKSAVPDLVEKKVEQLTILKNEITDSGKTLLIIENPKHERLTDIALTIRNAAVSRIADISGSDNLNTWFTIAEEVSLEKNLIFIGDVHGSLDELKSLIKKINYKSLKMISNYQLHLVLL